MLCFYEFFFVVFYWDLDHPSSFYDRQFSRSNRANKYLLFAKHKVATLNKVENNWENSSSTHSAGMQGEGLLEASLVNIKHTNVVGYETLSKCVFAQVIEWCWYFFSAICHGTFGHRVWLTFSTRINEIRIVNISPSIQESKLHITST